MRIPALTLCALAIAAVSGAVQAADASPWTVKVGLSQVAPAGDNGKLANDTLKADVSSEVGFTPAIEYKFAPNIVGEVLLAIPFQHEVKVTGGTLNDAKVAKFKHLPPTFSAKYLFTPDADFSPYVGLGVNYTLVFDEKTEGALASNKLDGKDSIGLAATAGFEYRMPNSPWGVALDVRYINIKSKLKLNGNDIGSLKVNPTVIGLSAAYHF